MVLSPTISINLGFITEGRLAAVLITPSLGVPNWSVIYINTAQSGTTTTQAGHNASHHESRPGRHVEVAAHHESLPGRRIEAAAHHESPPRRRVEAAAHYESRPGSYCTLP
jgi:hypothetical protein